MQEFNQLYKCNICGKMIEVVLDGAGELVCCNHPMEKINSHKSEGEFSEKHLPVMVTENNKKLVKIGSEPHPMTKEHYIMFVEAFSLDGKYMKRTYLNPDEKPEMEPECLCRTVQARAWCNIHGLWESITSLQ